MEPSNFQLNKKLRQKFDLNFTIHVISMQVISKMKLALTGKLFLTLTLLASLSFIEASDHYHLSDNILRRLIKSRSQSKDNPEASNFNVGKMNSPWYKNIQPQEVGSKELDKVNALPGQPNGVDFNQYAGYVTVDAQAGRALFYYFAESPVNSSTYPLVLWLNGGPGCSSFGYGAMTELGPFRVNRNGKTLFQNPYAWNNVANIIFLESPAGVGFSYSNTSSDYQHTGDKSTATDAYTFLVNWLKRFPQYKTRDFFIVGESYAGHYVPQLADTIVSHNKQTNQTTIINLKGIAIGNGVLNDPTDFLGGIDFFWSHALISDESYNGIQKYCDFTNGNNNQECDSFLSQASGESGNIYGYNIYAPLCKESDDNQENTSSVDPFDPCSGNYVESYLNIADVQNALHANHIDWNGCSGFAWTDRPTTVLPLITDLMANGIQVWIYSGDVDGTVPVTSTRYSISSLNLPVKTHWYPWYINEDEVGGYVEGYEGLTFVTVRGSGHFVPSYQPKRALAMITSFLQGVLPPQQMAL